MIPKFRVYETDRKAMHYTDKDLVVCFSDNGVDVIDHTTFSSSCMDIDNFVLMQSTGLKDENGVEIFEGDIVNVHEFIDVGGIAGYEEGEREMIGIVKYGCIFNSPIPEWYLENSDGYIPFSYIDLHDESFEVLGNKYAHPYLLEGDNE